MLEGKNLPKFRSSKGRKEVIAPKKCGKKTGKVFSEISGVMVHMYVYDICVPFS